jgi:hypothetical protein
MDNNNNNNRELLINVITFLESIDIKGSQTAYNLVMCVNGLKGMIQELDTNIKIDNTEVKKEK